MTRLGSRSGLQRCYLKSALFILGMLRREQKIPCMDTFETADCQVGIDVQASRHQHCARDSDPRAKPALFAEMRRAQHRLCHHHFRSTRQSQKWYAPPATPRYHHCDHTNPFTGTSSRRQEAKEEVVEGQGYVPAANSSPSSSRSPSTRHAIEYRLA